MYSKEPTFSMLEYRIERGLAYSEPHACGSNDHHQHTTGTCNEFFICNFIHLNNSGILPLFPLRLEKSFAPTMLRRKPTALTITSEDIAAFEEQHARAVAYRKYQKTGEDPNGYFSNYSGDYSAAERVEENVAGAIDPNDELKPLPGDKARIVRTREERIVGTGAGASTGTGGRR
jgi:hypothetical protein